MGAALALLIAGCSSAAGGSGSGSGSSGGASAPADNFTITAGVLHAFTGQNAFFGGNAMVACKAAALQINAAGGIMGHQITCTAYDTKGDPADAVPVTNRMLVSEQHLGMVLGPDGNDIPSVLPLLEAAKVPEMNTVGDPRYDHQTSKYFWRLTASDSTQAPALAYYATHSGAMQAVDVWTSDLSAQTTTTPFESAYKQMGGALSQSLVIASGQSSYGTEVSKVVSAKPQALIGEMDARTAATFLTQLQQQNGKLMPFIVTQRATQGDWAPAVAPAIGASNLAKYVTAVAPDLKASGPGYDAFVSSMKTAGANPFQSKNAFVAATYDGMIAFALAMDVAKSTDPSVWVDQIANVTAPKSGDTVVNTYADAVAALKAGKTIQYVGASGDMVFDQYNTAKRLYAAWNYDASAQFWKITSVLPAEATSS